MPIRNCQFVIRNFPHPTQRAIVAEIVAEIEAEQALVNANRELIRRMEAKVKAAIDRVWGKSIETAPHQPDPAL